MEPEEAKVCREALLRYCELDTWAMVKVWEKLKEVKHEIERVKSKSNVSLNNRQLVNVIILAFIKEHNDGYNHLASLCRLAKFYIGYLILYKAFRAIRISFATSRQ